MGAEFLTSLGSQDINKNFGRSARTGDESAPGKEGQAPRRKHPTVEAVTFGSAVATTAWAPIADLFPKLVEKGGAVGLGLVGVWIAWRGLKAKLLERKENRSAGR